VLIGLLRIWNSGLAAEYLSAFAGFLQLQINSYRKNYQGENANRDNNKNIRYRYCVPLEKQKEFAWRYLVE
jgi:hypothetical protein